MLVTEDDIEQVFRFGSPQEVRLRDGGIKFIRLAQPTPQKVQFFHQNRLLLAQRGIVHRTRWGGLPGEMEFAWWLDRPALIEERREEAFEASAAVSSDFRVPMGGGIVLRPYQAAGVEYMHKKNGFLLVDEMGLGKTLQIVGVINCNPRMDRVLIICPHKVRGNWWRELNRGLVHRRSIAFAEGGVWPTTDIVVIHYEIAYKFQEQLVGMMWDLVVIDEGHKLRSKNARMTRTILGGRANAAKGLSACSGIPGRVKAILTGTPLANTPMDLFPYLRWADRDFWGIQTDYQREYAMTSDGHHRLHRRLREWGMLRRLKRDVAKDLPEKTRTMIVIDPHTPEQLAVVSRDRLLMARHEDGLKRVMSEADFQGDVDASIIRALQIPATELSRMRRQMADALFPDALEQARDILEQKDKLVIYAHHRDIIFRLLDCLKEFRPVHCIGGISSDTLAQNIATFQRDPNCRVFVASITATGTGVDGLQEACSTCLFVEDDWLSVQIDQAEDRLHRIGQHSPVDCYHMALEGSIGIRILKVSMDKRRIADRVIDGSDAPAPTDSGVLAVKSYKPRSIFSKQRTGKIGTGMLPGLF